VAREGSLRAVLSTRTRRAVVATCIVVVDPATRVTSVPGGS